MTPVEACRLILTGDAAAADTAAVYAAAAAGDPVHRLGESLWVVTSYELSRHVLRTAAEFSLRPREGVAGALGAMAAGWAEQLEGPAHTVNNRALAHATAPAHHRALVEEVVADAVGALGAASGTVDLVASFARPLWEHLLVRWIGVPGELVPLMPLCTLVAAAVGGGEAAREKGERAAVALFDRLRPVVAAARDGAEDTVVARVAAGCDDDLAVARLVNVVVDATPVADALLLWLLALLDDPPRRGEVHDDVARVPETVREYARLDPAQTAVPRVASAGTSLAGRDVAPGDTAVVLPGPANRDGTVFEQPHEFRWGRTAPVLTFGAGIHQCVGRGFAEALSAEGTRRFLEAFPGTRVLRVEWVRQPVLRRAAVATVSLR